MATITVPALSTAQEMKEYLQEDVNDPEGNFRRALDCDVSHIDSRAQVYDVRITHVDMEKTSIGVSYEVDYEIYNGCKDMNIDDSEDNFVSGIRTASGWEFEEFVPPPRRTTVDEF